VTRRRTAQPGLAAAYEAALTEIASVCKQVAAGNFEPRVMQTPGAENLELVTTARHELNRVLDRSDAFVREAAASLAAASQGAFYREFLVTGMPGSFGIAAETINTARATMAAGAERIEHAQQARLSLADEFESKVMLMAEQVAAAATELSASAAGLAETAHSAKSDAGRAEGTVGTLEHSSREIQQVVALILQIAAQTKLLALNATIEAARAGGAGKGFAVVADEVKALAEETGRAAEQVTDQVEAVQSVSQQSTGVMHDIGVNVSDMAGMVDAIRVAVDGGALGEGYPTTDGLSQLAESLRAEVSGFLTELRR
jgi:methyl-accepting chemotaxis protein